MSNTEGQPVAEPAALGKESPDQVRHTVSEGLTTRREFLLLVLMGLATAACSKKAIASPAETPPTPTPLEIDPIVPLPQPSKTQSFSHAIAAANMLTQCLNAIRVVGHPNVRIDNYDIPVEIAPVCWKDQEQGIADALSSDFPKQAMSMIEVLNSRIQEFVPLRLVPIVLEKQGNYPGYILMNLRLKEYINDGNYIAAIGPVMDEVASKWPYDPVGTKRFRDHCFLGMPNLENAADQLNYYGPAGRNVDALLGEAMWGRIGIAYPDYEMSIRMKIHEIFHTFGIDHNHQNRRSYMNDDTIYSNDPADTPKEIDSIDASRFCGGGTLYVPTTSKNVASFN